MSNVKTAIEQAIEKIQTTASELGLSGFDGWSHILSDSSHLLQKVPTEIAEKDRQIASLQVQLANANTVIKNNSDYGIKERQKLQAEIAELKKRSAK